MTYNVFTGTLNPSQSINQSIANQKRFFETRCICCGKIAVHALNTVSNATVHFHCITVFCKHYDKNLLFLFPAAKNEHFKPRFYALLNARCPDWKIWCPDWKIWPRKARYGFLAHTPRPPPVIRSPGSAPEPSWTPLLSCGQRSGHCRRRQWQGLQVRWLPRCMIVYSAVSVSKSRLSKLSM